MRMMGAGDSNGLGDVPLLAKKAVFDSNGTIF